MAMSKKWYTRLVICLVIVSSAALILHSVSKNYTALSALPFQLSPALLLALFPLILMHFVKGLVHLKLLRKEGLTAETDLQILTSFFLSQVARYFPGKVMGIAVQSLHLTGSVVGKTVWRANFTQYIITNFYAVLFLLVLLLAYSTHHGSYLALLLPVCLVTCLFLRSNMSVLVFDWLLNVLKKSGGRTDTGEWNKRSLVSILVFLNLEWVCYFGFWVIVSLLDTFTVYNAIVFGSMYAAASFLGMLVVVMPSGLLVREASFVWLGAAFGFGEPHLIVYGVLARLLFTMSDLLVFGLFWFAHLVAARFSIEDTA
jgi:hypothetical protein